MRAAAFAALALLIAGCERGEEPQPLPVPPTPEPISLQAPARAPAAAIAPVVANRPAEQPVLTPDGYGPVRIGMPRAEVLARLGSGARTEDPNERGADDLAACEQVWSDDRPPGVNVAYMLERGVLTRVSVSGEGVQTGIGVPVGATDAEVRSAAGAKLIVEPHKYSDSPAAYLLLWTAPERRGYVFETDGNRIARTVHAGGPSIRYVEGCL